MAVLATDDFATDSVQASACISKSPAIARFGRVSAKSPALRGWFNGSSQYPGVLEHHDARRKFKANLTGVLPAQLHPAA